MPTKFQLITELYDQTVQSVTGSYQSWTGFLRAACYNYKCPFDDQILIYAQRPDATAVLEMERWNRQFGRWVNRGAKSIAVFGDDGQNCLKLYFDVSDTHASRFSRPLPIWTMHPAFEPEVIETLEATFGNLAEKENLADAVRSACHNAVADNFTDYLQDLRDCREDSLLEELDDLNLEAFYRGALEVSVAYMLMTRLGLRADDYFTADEFAHVYEFNTPPTINALGIATSDIAEMGLREISRTVMQAQRDQFFANREKSRYQLVESKQKFISQIMTSKSPVRSAEDVDEQALSYAEIKALASGNPMIKEKMDLDIEVSKLKLLKANHLSQKYALEDAISKGFPKQIAETQARIAGYGADIATVKENTHPNGDGFSPLTLAGVTHADKKEAGAALLTMCQTMLSPEATQIGSYRGLTLELAFDTFAREYRLTMIGQLRHTVTLGTDVFGNLQRMDNALEGLPIKEQTCREQLSNLQTQLETAKVEVQKPFPREAELNTKTARLEELNTLLNLDHKEPEIVDAEPDEDQRPPERRRPQLER